jgi:hypothetical protein
MPSNDSNIPMSVAIASRLHDLARARFLCDEALTSHYAGLEYISLMVSFLLHFCSTIDAMLSLWKLNPNIFPVSNALVLTRCLFEVNVTALYISDLPKERAISFIEYHNILRMQAFHRLSKHKDSDKAQLSSYITAILQQEYIPDQKTIEQEYARVKAQFEFTDRNGKLRPFSNWANKSLKEIAQAVNHEIEYDLFYPELSEFTHSTVHLADLFLKSKHWPPQWSTHADEDNIDLVFAYASEFFSCFLSRFAQEFKLNLQKEIDSCAIIK